MADDRRDLSGALLAFAFVLLLLAGEAALSLPDETASDTAVATFYAGHRGAVIVLQLAGLLAAGLPAAYAVRLRRVDRAVGNAALLTRLLACAPALVTIVLAPILFVVLVGTLGVLSARGRLEARGSTAAARASA